MTCLWKSPLVILAIGKMCAQAPARVESARDAVALYCRLDFEGKRLSAAAFPEIASLLDNAHWFPVSEVTVVKDYTVHPGLRAGRDDFDVVYEVWGHIDASLRFIQQEGIVAGSPVRQEEYLFLSRGRGGANQWRVTGNSVTPYVGVGAALAYLGQAARESADPALRRNAIESAASIEAMGGLPEAKDRETPAPTPVGVMREFAKRETEGAGLTAEGLKALGEYFVTPPVWERSDIWVIKDFGLSNASLVGREAGVAVEYVTLGDIDSTLRFSNPFPNPIKMKLDFHLVQATRRGTPQWLIDGSNHDPWITVDAAIRYLQGLARTTTDAGMRRNAQRSIAALMAMR